MRRSLAVLLAAAAFAGGAFAMAAVSNPGPDGIVHACVGSHDEVLVHADGTCAGNERQLDLNQPPISAGGRAEILASLAEMEATIAANDSNARQLSRAVAGLEVDESLSGFSKEQKRQLRKWMNQVGRFAKEADDSVQGISTLNRAFNNMAKSIIQNIRA